MKRLSILTILSLVTLLHQTASADMPSITNTTTETYQRVSSGDIACESRTPHPTINAGVYDADKTYQPYYTGNVSSDHGVYVAVSIPLTMGRSTVDCNQLYKTALDKERLRIQQLELQLNQMRGRQITAD